MPVDRMAQWIKKHGETKAVKDWLAANPPPADFTGTPQEYAYAEMPDDAPVDDPLEPDLEEMPEGAPVTRREHDELRDQVARVAKKFNRALKNSQRQPDTPPSPAPAPEPSPAPVARTRGGVAAILDPLRRRG